MRTAPIVTRNLIKTSLLVALLMLVRAKHSMAQADPGKGGSPVVSEVYADNITTTSATLHGTVYGNGLQSVVVFQYGKTTSYGTTTTEYATVNPYQTLQVSITVDGLDSNCTYHFRLRAGNNNGFTDSEDSQFYTTTNAPTATTLSAEDVTSNSATLRATINPNGIRTTWAFQMGTSTDFDTQLEGGNLAAGSSDRSVSLPVSNMTPNTTYYYRVIALHTNPISIVMGATKSVTTEEVVVPDCFDDCTSSSCGENGAQMYEAAQYLCARGIVEGINYDLLPDQEVTRAQLAKVALFGLYNGPDNIPNPLVTDYFPSIYPDLQNDTAYYYQAAKALLYLEYGDGRSPFDRDRAVFDPTGTISRCLVLKVLLETFNIAPATSGSNPFSDYDSSDQFWGYAKKAYDLGIVQVSTFNPHQNCTRGQAFLFLYRIMTGIANNTIPAPNPINSESPATSSFFIPANLSAEVVNAMRGVEYGNYNYYQKDFFGIPGYMYLSFGISYNSYLTEMPEDFYPVQPLGKAWTHTYDMYMNIVTDPYNNLSYYVFHLRDGALLIYDNDLSTVTEGNFYTLSQSGSKFILKSVDQVTYTFEKKSTSDGIYYLTQIKDRNDNTIDITYAYGSSHYRITSVSTLGRTLSFYYKSGTDLLYYVKDPIFRKVYFYYTDDQLTSLKDAKNQTTSFEYGTMDFEKGLLKRITLPRGNEVCNNYQQRKLTSTRYNNDIPTTISIVPSYQNGSTNSRVIRPVDGNHVDTTDYTMNGNNCITRMKNSEKDLSFSYGDSNHATLVSQMTDNKSNLHASYTYNVKGLITQISVSAGGETVTTKFTYDVNNNVRSYTDANNNKTNYYYDSNGNLTSVKDPLGNTTTITNNSYGSPTQVTNPMGVTTTYQYNSYGNVTNIAVPSLNLSGTITYDDVSRIISKTDMGGNLTSYTYDANDNVLTETDALNNVTTYAFDANDNVTSITNAKGFSTFMTYDDNDFVTSVAFQNAIRNYTYNNDGTLKSYTDPNGHVFNYSYNDAGDLLNDGYATYSYNNKGMLTSVTKDNKAIEYAYDAFYRVSSVSYDGKTVSYTYDYNNNITSITYPGNKTVTYSYDALNRMTSVTDWNNATTTYSYRDDNQLSYYQYPNQVRTTIGYDNAGRCTSMTTRRSSGNGSTISSYDFTLNSLGSHVQESITEPFASYPTIPSVGITYSYNNANRLLSAGDLTFTYDNNGNTTSRSGRNYSYDSKDNLTGVSGDFTASYSYDGWGYRRSATRNGESKKYVLDLLSGDGNVIMETDNSGNALYYYVYGVSGLISRISASNETRYYVYDYRGSTVAMTDASTAANITHQYQYDDFGKVLQSQESDANSFQFVGQYGVMYEAEGLTFMRARYYDESVGRFLSEDPIWSVNLYPYAGNNPISFIDPNGNKSIELCLWGGEKMKNAITTLRTAASNYSAAGGQKAHIATELEHSLTSSTVETPQFAQKINEAYNETKPVVNNVVQNSSNFVQNSSSEVANQTALLGGSAGAAIGYAAVGVGVVVGASAGAYYLGKAGHKGWAYGVGVGGGIAGGALAGAAIGSFFGPAGLVVGAIIGGAVGGVLGYLNARAGVNQYYEDNRYTL